MGISAVYRKTGIVAAVATVLAGWLLVLPRHTPNPLVRWSYDLLQLVLREQSYTDIAIIYVDEQAMQDYGQKPESWDRSLYARLLARLTDDEARVVVFDVTMTGVSNRAADDKLANAIGRNGRVVLAAEKVPVSGFALSYTIVPPLKQFETNAAAWGTAKVQEDPDQVGRRYLAGDDQECGLPCAAAKVAGSPVIQNEERWLNYYGSARPFEHLSMTYTNAETREARFFRDKAVFIGGKPETLSLGDITDVFGTPFTKWNSRFIPGVDLTAIAYANLMHNDWLRRMGFLAELGLLLVTGAVAGFGLQRVRLRTTVWLALLMTVLLIAGSIALVLLSRTWFPWVVVGLVQLPCAVLFRFFADREAILAAPLEADSGQATLAPDQELPETIETIQDGRPEIADHTLIRCIGEGAYGQVWIARNAIGLYHAVKVVYRSRFAVGAPFERALRGIHKFMPISRSHEGFVHILHVGRNERAGFFFYIMEAGDDETTGQQIDPATYAPKTLASELRARETMPPRECLEFMLAVTEAAERLHQHQLIHRDIKPANIIFVNRRPKLADIDLVTDLSAQGETSRIGTEGYMAPEGPGTAAADVFSLGRILYVALTGKPPDHCPELPTQVGNQADCGLFLELNRIICKACDLDLDRRYPSAALMRADLLEVFQRLGK
jgi:CHASE2 domain-containing sensor protein